MAAKKKTAAKRAPKKKATTPKTTPKKKKKASARKKAAPKKGAATGKKASAKKKKKASAKKKKEPTSKPKTATGKKTTTRKEAGSASKSSAKQTAGASISAMDVNLGHVFSLRPRVNTSFRQNDFFAAKRALREETFESIIDAARAVAEEALALTRGEAVGADSKRHRRSSNPARSMLMSRRDRPSAFPPRYPEILFAAGP